MQPTSTAPPRDFSGAQRKVKFTADGDTFYGVPRVATKALADAVSAVQRATNLDEQLEGITLFVGVCLEDESAELFRTRLADKQKPIDVPQAMDIIGYLTEVYADRPTKPSPPSSSGSTTEDTGTSSTDGVPSEVSIPLSSPPIAS